MSASSTRINRREFLSLTAAASTGMALASQGAVGLTGADLVLINGQVLCVDDQDSVAQAVAIKDGLITQVGSTRAVSRGITRHTQVINLQGKTVTPGLVDSHIHVLYLGKQNWEGFVDIRLPNVTSREDLLRVISEKAATLPHGEWVSGNQGFLLPLDQAPDRWELDEACPDHPVYLRHMGGQYGVVNSLALDLAGIDASTPNPPGGVVVKDPDTGEPTGMLNHYSAQNLVGRMAPGWGPRTDEELMEDILRAQELCLAAGYTSGQDVIVGSSRDVEAYKNVAMNHDLKMRMYLMQYVGSAAVAREELLAVERFKSGMLTFGGWKLAVDGGLSAGTALMYDTGLPMSERSYPYYSQDTMNQMVTVMHQAGFQVSFHCTGDRAIDMAINAIEAALTVSPNPNHRHRIEHLLFPTPEALQRIRDLDIIVSTQPQWISMLGDGYKNVSDEATMARFMPLRTMKDMGIRMAFGCDVPATPYLEPNWAFAGGVTRTTWLDNTYNPDECISMSDVLRIHTMGSAYASFEESDKGSIEVGKAGDLVVWSHDLLTLDPVTDLTDLKADMTVVAGQVVYVDEQWGA